MILAVLSDIHSNHPALTACVEEALRRGAERFLFLGDLIGECAYPQKTFYTLRRLSEAYDCRFVRGNREDYMLEYRERGEQGWAEGSGQGCLLYTYENLTPADLDWFAGLPVFERLELPELPPLTYCHGSPGNTRELLLPGAENTKKWLEQLDTPLLCGHTHRQGVCNHTHRQGVCNHTHRQGVCVPTHRQDSPQAQKRLINPGSCGMPEGFGGKAQFALLHGEKGVWREELLQIPYNTEEAVSDIRESGLSKRAPVWIAMTEQVLRTGEHAFVPVLERTRALCRAALGELPAAMPERFWIQAAEEAGIRLR